MYLKKQAHHLSGQRKFLDHKSLFPYDFYDPFVQQNAVIPWKKSKDIFLQTRFLFWSPLYEHSFKLLQ